MWQVETQAERYLPLDALLFRIQDLHDEQSPVLCISESCVDHILDLYHNSLFGAHQGCLRKILTIKQMLPNLMHYVKRFLRGCEICQLHKAGPTHQRQFENRVNLNYTSMSKLSCDIKYMYIINIAHRFILAVTDEVTNYPVTIPLRLEEHCMKLEKNV